MKKTLHIFLILFTANNFVNAQDGSLDLSFGTGGKVVTSVGVENDYAKAVVVQSDEKILVTGYSFGASGDQISVVRYNTDGTLDNTFNLDGKVITTVGFESYGNAIVLQSDGKILVAGSTRGGSSKRDFVLVRYNSDGSLDNSFDLDGIVITDINGYNDNAYSLGIQSDGKIVVVGTSEDTVYINDFAIARYNSNGALDFTFDLDGIAITDIGSSGDNGQACAIQSDGKIIVAGYSNPGLNYDFALTRYNTDGTLDTSFDFDGKVLLDLMGNQDFGYSVAIQSDNKIIVVGSCALSSSNIDFGIARFNANGSLDNTFSGDGKTTTNFGADEFAYSVKVQSDGKIVVGGKKITLTPNSLFAMARFNNDGMLDLSFDLDGKVVTDFPGTAEYASSLAIQSDSKIILAGTSYNGINYDFSLARYNVSPIGIQETNSSSTLNIFPNPTNGKINLELKQSLNKASIKIIDLTGQTILSQQNASGNYFTFDVSNYSTGLYFLEVEENGSFERIKFVKE